MLRVTGLKFNLVGIFAAFGCSYASADIPADSIDLDRTVAFSELRSVTMYRAYGDPNLFYVLASRLDIARTEDGATDATLLHTENSKSRSFLSLKLKVGSASKDVEGAIREIKANNPMAKFANIEPTSFKYTVFSPQAAGGVAKVETTQVLGDRSSEVIISVDSILKRILLVPTSYKFDSLSVVAGTVIKGVTRDRNGEAKIGSRFIDLTAVFRGSCAIAPERYINIDTGQIGCVHPKYAASLILPIQKALKEAKILKGDVDGRYGPDTESAIREFQHASKILVDGIPTLSLLQAISSKYPVGYVFSGK